MIITIAICTHNRAQIVCEAIEAVFKFCNPKDFELIVVDNASTDNTNSRLTELQQKFDFSLIYEEELGLSHARNQAIKHAKMKYIIFLDDDGEVSEGWLDGFLSVINNQDNLGAVGGKIKASYAKKPPSWLTDEGLRFYGEFDLGNEIKEVTWVPGGNSAWKLDAVKALNGFNPDLGRIGSSPVLGSEESVIADKLLQEGYKLLYSPTALMYHKIGFEKLTLKWLMMRYYGQGVTAITIQKMKGRFKTNVEISRQVLASFKNLMKMLLCVIKSFLLFRFDAVVQNWMQVCRYFGEIHTVCAINKNYKKFPTSLGRNNARFK